MNSSIDAISDESLSRLVFESQETERSIKAPPPDVFERVRQFIVLYRDLAAKPLGAGLLYQRGREEEGQFQPLERKLVVGRLSKSGYNPAGCDLPCDDPRLSRHHFEIELVDSFFVLRDLQSRNGTYLNQQSERVTEVILKEGDIISAGSRAFIFLSDDARLRPGMG
ncbi:MAG: FHA domain-containing protein [Chthoniobacterales bacterium]|nr:FHA domain-containing protein [Chthoniobacterales bacterium]